MDTTTNPLRQYFDRNTGLRIFKWIHYFDIYHRHFEVWRGRSPVVLEIGVGEGGSLQMWKWYFGKGARIIGIDLNPKCKLAEEDGIEVVIGDQGDRGFLKALSKKVDHFDIIIDDGSHRVAHQIAAYEELFGLVSENGIYLVEDLHTNYWSDSEHVGFGGGFRKAGTFVEYSKNLIDHLSAWHIRGELPVSTFTRSARSMTYYDSVLVIEKNPNSQPSASMIGKPLGE